MLDFIIAILVILFLLSSWIFVQYLSQYYASRHPEFGPARQEGGGCGKSCLCSDGNCKNKRLKNQEELSHDLPQ